MTQTNESVAYAYAISSKTQKLSVQPNSRLLSSILGHTLAWKYIDRMFLEVKPSMESVNYTSTSH
jgi:hypothetical protein